MSGSRPDLLLIGAARSGTSALVSMLSEHPDIGFTTPKETHFFAFAGTKPAQTGPGDEETVNRLSITQPTAFAKCCESVDAPLVGEGSVTTMYYPETSLRNIASHADPDVKLVALLRHPVERAFSAFMYLRWRGFEPETSFARALELESERIRSGYSHMWHLRAQGRYAEQLEPFIEAFGRDRLLVLFNEEFVEQPHRTLAAVCNFLDVDPSFEVAVDRSVNRGGEPRSQLLGQAMRTMRRSPLSPLMRKLTTAKMRARFRESQLTRPDLPAAVREELTEEFRPDVARLSALLGRDLAAWPDFCRS